MAQQGLSPLIWTMRRRFSVRGVDKCLIWWVWMNDLEKKSAVCKKKMKMMTRRRGPKERNLQLPSFQSVVCWTLCVISISSSDLSKVCVSRCLHPAPADQRDLDGQIPSSGGFLTSQPFHQTHPKLPSATHAGRNLFPLVNSGKHSCGLQPWTRADSWNATLPCFSGCLTGTSSSFSSLNQTVVSVGGQSH